MRNEFEGEIGQLLKSIFPVAERLDDVAYNRGGGRQVKRKPYDYYGATLDGTFWGAEVKRVKSPRFPLRNFKAHQHNALWNLEHHTCKAWVFINWREGGERGTGTAVWIPYWYFAGACEIANEKGVKSIKPADLALEMQLGRISGGWEVPPSHIFYNYVLAWKSYTMPLNLFESDP